jgi:hypothetical protein
MQPKAAADILSKLREVLSSYLRYDFHVMAAVKLDYAELLLHLHINNLLSNLHYCTTQLNDNSPQ